MTTQTLLTQVPFNAYPWQAGHAYAPGDVVTPTTSPNAGATNITNADFASNITGWSGTGFSWDGSSGYNSTGCARQAANTTSTLLSSQKVAVTPGQVITCSCFVGGSTNPGFNNQTLGNIILNWYDSTSALLTTNGQSVGLVANAGIYGIVTSWQQSTLTATAPAGAAFAAVGCICTNTSSTTMAADAFVWNYQAPTTSTATTAGPQFFTSIAASLLTSGLTEPDWTNGGSNTGNVSDNGITWSRGAQPVIYWTACAMCYTAAITQPVWPTGAGSMIIDGTQSIYWDYFHWQAQTPEIQDSSCPHTSTVVCIGASHIFAGNGDIVNFSASTNCLDWSSLLDAGFLATGLQNYGANSVSAMGLYRSNLCVFNSQGFQIWQIDEDPEQMALIEAIPIGCSYSKTVVPVNTDLFFCAAQGVRSVSISGGSGNTQAGDIGMPIDALVQAGLAYCNANGTEPLATYIPSAGQYWIYFPGWQAANLFFNTPASTSNVLVYSMTRTGQVGAWGRYNFPFANIEAFCPAGDNVYIQAGDDTLMLDVTALYDYSGDFYNGITNGRRVSFQGVVQWPWLDFGSMGVSKKLNSIDVVSSDNAAISLQIGYDQTNTAAFTTAYSISADTVPGAQIPMPLLAPSFAVRLIMDSTTQWQIQSVNLYITDAPASA